MNQRDDSRRAGHRTRRAPEGAPLAASSALPLFPSDTSESRPRQAEGRPLGVRRATPAVPRLRSEPAGRGRDRQSTAPARPRPDRGLGLVPARASMRVGAAICDLGLLAALDLTVLALTLRLAGLDWQTMSRLPTIPLGTFLLLLNIGYVTMLTAIGGQTFGKMAFGIRVVDTQGDSVSFSMALVRSVGYLVSWLPLGLGALWMAIDADGRALHDLLAGTRVRAVWTGAGEGRPPGGRSA